MWEAAGTTCCGRRVQQHVHRGEGCQHHQGLQGRVVRFVWQTWCGVWGLCGTVGGRVLTSVLWYGAGVEE